MPAYRELVRNRDGPDFLLQLLVCAVGTVLGIRFYLHLTGYPQIGGGGLHIAHMLWGGALMVTAIILLLGFLGRRSQRLGAILGGIGFGAFIDELGKFITHNNDYFFQPTVALIYVIFILLAIVFHALAHSSTLSAIEYQVNALRTIEDALIHGLTPDRGARLRSYLDHAETDDDPWGAIMSLSRSLHMVAPPPLNAIHRVQVWLHQRYAKIADHPSFHATLVLAFAVHAIFMVASAVMRSGLLERAAANGLRPAVFQMLSFAHRGELLAALASRVSVRSPIGTRR